MTIQDFIRAGQRSFADYMKRNDISGVTVREEETVKINDLVLHGMEIHREGSNMGIRIYADDLYCRMGAGGLTEERMIDELVRRMIDVLDLEEPPVSDADKLDFGDFRTRLSVRLIDARLNKCYMKDRPYIDAGCGFAMIPKINCTESARSPWSVSVTDSMLEGMHIGRDELLTEAFENTIKHEKPVLFRLSDIAERQQDAGSMWNITDHLAEDLPVVDAAVLTNESQTFGAAVLFYPGLMDKVGELMGRNYYIIPSSTHELVLIPEDPNTDPARLEWMLGEANSNIVSPEDLLSYTLLYYDREACELRTACCSNDMAA